MIKFTFLCIFPFQDPFGNTDEHEPLTNAIQSDSAFIGGNLSSFLKAGEICMTLLTAESYMKSSLHMIIQNTESDTLCLAL